MDFKIKSLKRYAEFLPILAFAVALVLGSIAGLNHGMIGKTTSFNPLKEISIAIGLDNTGLDKTVEIQKAPEPKEAEKPSISRGSFVAGGSSGGGSFQTTVEQHGDYPVYHAKMIGYEDPFQIKDYTVKVIGDKEIFVNFTLGFNDSWTKKELMQHYSADKDVSICIRNRQTSFNNISDMDTNFPVGLLKKGFYEYNQDGKAWVCSTITGSNLWSNLGVIREQGRWFSGVIHLSDWANFEISFGTGSTVILLSFAPPTLADNATITATSAQINISITNASDLAEMKFNWNGTNYTIYNDSLLLMLNFDSVDNSTKVNDVSRYGNNGTLSGSNFANFDDSPDSFVADCDAAVNYSFVSGKFGDAVKIWSNSGASGEGCFYKYTGTLKAGNVFWVWAKGRVMMQLHNGTRLSQIEDMAGNIYAYNTGQNYSDWTLFKLVVTENSSAAGNMLILYSRESASGEENAGYYDFIWNGTYFANGKYGSALSFDGVNDFMQGTGVGTKANDYSFSLWIKPSQIGVFMDIIEFNKNNFYPALTVASDNRFLLYLNPTYYLYSIGNAEYQSKKDTWIHLAATINSSNYTRLYINGVDQSGSGDLSGSPAAMNNEYVLANVYYSIQYFNGSIDEVRVWNRSLSASEVKQLYYSNFNKYDIDKWLFYVNESNLTDGTYTYYGYAKDTSGNENTTGTRTLTAGIPSIQFVSPTPSNGTVTTNTSVVINVSITEVNLKEVKKNWNGTNYTFYNDSLLLMMNFDNVSALGENATKAVDVSKWGNNGTLGNATAGTQPTWNATGRYGGAYTFDGVNDYIETPSINIGTGAVTFSAWVKGNVMGANHEQGIIEFYNSTRPWFFTLEKATYNNTLTIYVGYNDQTPNTISSPSGLWPASDTNWHHVLMTRNSSEIVLYFDGNRVANSSHSNFVNFNIGNRPVRVGYPSEQYWDGSIDEVRVWNRSLSADEIKQQYYSNLNKYDTDKWIFYENESLPEPYSSMTYNYYSCAKDTAGNENCTDTRQLTSQSIMPLISFVSPTPDNRTNTTNTSFVINVSITEANLNTLTKNWNGTNYTFYNDSLVLMMNFENLSVLGENSTFVKDLSKYGNNGNCSGTGCPTWNVSGRYGGAYTFDGVNDYVTLARPISGIQSANYSISAWVRQSAGVGATNFNEIFYQGYDGAHEIRLELNVVNCHAVFNTYEAGYGSVSGTTNACDGRWHYLTAVKSGNTGYIYVDGNQQNSGTVKNVTSTDRATIGAARYTGGIVYFFNGSIDEVRIWNRSLSADEVKQQYYSNLNKYDVDKWIFYENESLPEPYSSMTYNYYSCAKDAGGNENCTETRQLTSQSITPLISFVSPTPENGTTTTNTSVITNVSITEANLKEVKKNWNGTNYTLYNDSLIVIYNFDNVSALGENSTYAVDVSKWGNDGACSGTTCPVWTQSGKYGGAYVFDGVDDYIETASSNLLNITNPFSLFSWIKAKQDTDSYNAIAGQYNFSYPNGYGYLLYLTGGKIRANVYAGASGSSPLTIGTNYLNDSTWHYVGFTFNGSIVNLYEDGILVSNSSFSYYPLMLSNKITIGLRRPYTADQMPFNGSIDEVRLWNRSLSADEIKQQYYSNLNKYDTAKWILYENESLPEPYGSMTYNYYSCAKDTGGNENCTETRTLTSQATYPGVSFVSPTPANGTSTTNTSIVINVSITNASNLAEIKKNWNGTNYTFYNDSLVLMMNFDNVSALGENSSLVKDLSKYGNNGTCSGTTCPTWNASGRYGGAYTFEGVSKYFSLTTSYLGPINHTECAWFQTGSPSVSAPVIYAERSSTSGTPIKSQLYLSSSKITYISRNDSNIGIATTGLTTILANTWYYACGVKANNVTYVYLNGVLEGSNNSAVGAFTVDRFTIGAYYFQPSSVYLGFFNGTIDELRTWNRSLSADEIKQQYYSNLNKYDTDKWVLYENESLPEPYGSMTYNYQSCAKDTGGNENCTETRTLTSQATYPGVSFVSPTPANGTSTTNTSIVINVSITNASNLAEIKKNWNGTNYTFYNDSLVLMMNFDNVSALGENSSLVKDLSKYGNNGTCSGTTCPTWNASGRYGGAYKFDGNNDYIDAGDINATDNTTSLTYEAWIYRTGGDTTGGIISKYASTSSLVTLSLGGTISGGDDLVLRVSNGSTSYGYTSSNLISLNQWYHVVMVFNGSATGNAERLKLYLNNENRTLNFSGTIPSTTPSTTSSVLIGWYADKQHYFGGMIDEARIWNRSLTADEVKQHYYSNLNKYDADKWILYENESNLTVGDYTYFSCAKDIIGNENCTETRSLTIISGVDTTAPYWHNNQSNHTTKYGEDVWFSVNWTDDTAVDYSIFSYNSTDNALLTNDTAYDCNDALTCLHNVTKTITQTRGETFCWMFYANDTSNNWNETDLWCFEIENTAPTHTTPILNASGYENYTTYDLTCYNQSTNDVDGDPVTNRFQWYKNGVEQTALENITTVLSGNTSAGEVWRCEITPNDGYADGITRASNNLTILELPDTTPPLVFLNLPANATSFTATNNVTFNVSATDNVDLDNCTLYTNISGTWQSNGTKVFAGTSYSDVWGVYNLNNGTYVWNAYCCDNSSNCNWNNTNFTFTVSYTPPDTTPPLVFLNLPANATNFTSTNNVTFNVSATEDTDLDNCTLYTNISGSWSANETKTFTGTSDEDLWNFYNLTIGNYKWNAYCCDNSSNCAWNNTNFTFTVSYTPSVPDTEAPLVFLNSPANGQVFGATNDITFNVSATDNVDLDNCTLYTNVSGSWQANETKTFTGLSDEDIWTLNDLANGDYKWNAYCCDNNSNCAWNNTNFTFTVNIGAANNPPTHTKPVLNSTYGTNYTYENLTCYNQSTSDSDGDPVTNRFQWYNNGVEQTSLENLTTVVAGYTAKGENWSCAVTPNDGEDDGTTLFSDNLTIRNALPTQSTPYIGAHNIFTNGLVAEYQFEDRAKDETGVNNGTINGATWTDEGRVGKAYEFDGVDDTISISDDTSLSFGNGSDDNSLSISAWINMKDATGFGILSKDDYSSNREYGFFTVGSDVLAVYFFDQSTGGYIGRLAPAMTSYEGIWVHVAATYTGSGTNEGIKLYVNGIQVDNGNNSDGNYTAMENLASPVQIARKTSLYGEGTIDEVLIFNRSLHPSEILLIYNTSKGDYADSNQDLGCSANNTYDADNDTVKNIYNWYMNDSSIAVLNMPFEAGSNSTWTRDYTPFGNNGTVTNAIWNSTGGYDNKGAYEFDGDDYINVGTGVNLQDKYTIVAWFKTIDSSIYQTIFGSDTGSEALLRIVDGKLTGTAYVGFYAEWPNYYVSGLTTIQNNIWYHVAFVVDGVNLTLYLNGAKDGNDTAQAINITNNNNPSYIGQTGMSWSRQWWNGTIDEVLVFNRSLTAEQILELYNNRTQTIVANETSCGENWSCEITPNDQDPDGATFGSKDVPICCDGDGDGFCSLVDCDETATYIYSAPDGTCDEDNDGFIDYEAFVDPFAAIALGEQPDFVPENNKCQCVVNDAATHCNPPGGPIQKWCTVADVTCGSCDLLSCTSNEQCTKFGEGWHCVEHSPGTCEGPGPVPEFTTIGIIAAIIISLLGAVLIVHRRIKKKKHKKTKKKKR